jgi:hypothetical protein
LYQPFEAAARKLHGQEGLQFGVIDCSAKLPAGKTTLQRFQLNKKIQPVIFVKSPENRKMRQVGTPLAFHESIVFFHSYVALYCHVMPSF